MNTSRETDQKSHKTKKKDLHLAMIEWHELHWVMTEWRACHSVKFFLFSDAFIYKPTIWFATPGSLSHSQEALSEHPLG